MRNPHAGAVFTDDDTTIAKALEDVSIPTLLLSCVHMARSEEERQAILTGPLKPQGLFLNEVQGFMSPEDMTAARELALGVITDYRDRGCPEPDPVSPALLQQMMDWIACEEVPPEYVPMLLEEMALRGSQARTSGTGVSQARTSGTGGSQARTSGTAGSQARTSGTGRQDLPVVIIGCGMSGLLAAIRLQEAGFPYVIVEKNAGVGGTWFENTYPGARVDVGNHFYCYSFEASDHWTEFFAQQPELKAYFEGVLEKYDVGQHVHWSTEVTGATWDEETGTWAVSLDTGETLTGRALISAVGQLNRPNLPEVPGEFGGPQFHTSRWDHDVDITGRKLVMVGAGATGFQVAPTIAPDVEHLTVIQRSAQWMFPNPNYHEPVGPGVQWALRHLPFYGRWYRFLIFWPGCDKGLAAAQVDPAWEPQETSISEVNDLVRMMFTDWITSQVEDDPELIAKVVPTYPPTGKRTLQDNGSWLKALTRDNVDLVRAGVDHLEPGVVVDSDGGRHEADVLVWATGFRANDMLLPLRITGRDGVDLREHWGTRPRAYLGMTVPGFPNFFCLYGPGMNLASGGSLIFQSEIEVGYVVQCLEAVADGGHRSIEPTQQAYDDWYEKSQAELRMTVWASPHIEHNYYKNDDGEVHTLSPFRLVDLWAWLKHPDLEAFEIR